MALAAWGVPPGGELVIQSALPVGKGMASSTADMVAAVRAAAAYYGVTVRARDLARWASTVEPSDGIMYPFVAAFNPVAGRLLERLGPVPRALVVGAIGSGRVNTAHHLRTRRPYSPAHQARLKDALSCVRRGLFHRDVAALGEAGLISAEVQYERTGDAALGRLIEAAHELGVGVMVGHTGTVRGWLVPRHVPPSLLHRLEQRLRMLDLGPCYRLEIGGVPQDSLSGRGAADVPLGAGGALLAVEGRQRHV